MPDMPISIPDFAVGDNTCGNLDGLVETMLEEDDPECLQLQSFSSYCGCPVVSSETSDFLINQVSTNNTVDFGELDEADSICINETLALDEIPEVGAEQFYVTNTKLVESQIFLINQKALDYSPVNTSGYESVCTDNNGTFLIANVTALCRRRSISDTRILQRVTYLGVDFPVCAAQQCGPDANYDLVFAHSLVTGHEFFHSTGVGEYWVCSAGTGWSKSSISGLIGILTAATAWFLM